MPLESRHLRRAIYYSRESAMPVWAGWFETWREQREPSPTPLLRSGSESLSSKPDCRRSEQDSFPLRNGNRPAPMCYGYACVASAALHGGAQPALSPADGEG